MSGARRTSRLGRWKWATLPVGLAAVLLAHPVWLPWALRPVAARLGVAYARCERLGYSRLALTEVRWTADGVEVQVQRAETLLPPGWLWRMLRGPDATRSRPRLEVMGWAVTIGPRPTPSAPRPAPTPDTPQSTGALLDRLEDLLAPVRNWLGWVRLRDGHLHIHGESIAIAALEHRGGRLTAKVSWPRWPQRLGLAFDLATRAPHTLALDLEPFGLSWTNRLERDTNAWLLTGALAWASNRVTTHADFSGTNWWPRLATLEAAPFRLPPEALGLAGYRPLDGAMRAAWNDGQYELSVQARAEPAVAGDVWRPPVRIEVAARGDLAGATLDAGRLELPGFEAALTDPTRVSFVPPYLAGPAAVRVAAVLERLGLPETRGQVEGLVQLGPSTNRFPSVALDLRAGPLAWREWTATRASVAGTLRWPIFELRQARLELPADSAVEVRASVDLTDRTFAAGAWQIRGPYLGRFLPTNAVLETFAAQGTAQGPWLAPIHQGGFTATGRLHRAGLATGGTPLRLEAQWQGERLSLNPLTVAAALGEFATDLGATVQVDTAPRPRLAVALRKLELRRAATNLFQLAAPAGLAFAAATPHAPWDLEVRTLDLRGPGRELTVQATARGLTNAVVEVHARNWRGEDFAGLLPEVLLPLELRRLAARADWAQRPARFQVAASAAWQGPGTPAFALDGELAGDAGGVRLENLAIQADERSLLRARGTLPFTWTPTADGPGWNVLEEQPLDLHAEAEPGPLLEAFLPAERGFQIDQPRLTLAVTGRPQAPQGLVRGGFRSLSFSKAPTAHPLPAVSNLVFEVRLDGTTARLDAGRFELAGSVGTFGAALPFPLDLRRPPRTRAWAPDLDSLTARLSIPNLELAALGASLPASLSPQGRLRLDWRCEPGRRFAGTLEAEDVATRATAALPALRDVGARIELAGRTARIARLEGQLGGARLRVSGEATLPTNGPPELDIVLRGTNVPLVRKPGLWLRADLDLAARQTQGQPMRIGGTVTLGPSLVVQNLDLLLPAPNAGPGQRPPYFRLDTAPFADWRLDLAIRGDRTLQLRSPLFQGVGSANLRLGGTLGDPVLSGELRANSGHLRFPFGRLEVQQATVSLLSDAPAEPRLQVKAASRNYGYALQMEVTGTARQPQVLLSSTPPLSSQEILMLLTAGEVPDQRLRFSDRDRASRLGMFVGQDFLSRLGLTRDSESRLEIRSGENLTSQGRSTYRLEYHLTDDWSAIGEYDQYGGVNGGLKWRIFSR